MLVKRVYLTRDGIEMLIGALETAVMRALWANRTTTRGIYRFVKENYEPQAAHSDEIAFTTVTTTVTRLYENGLVNRAGTRNQYTFTPVHATESAFERECLLQVIQRLYDNFGDDLTAAITRHYSQLKRANSEKAQYNASESTVR